MRLQLPQNIYMFQRKRPLWISCGVLLGIMVWVIANAPHDSLWYDETVNAYLATSSWETIWEWTTKVDNQVPLHFVALKLWIPFLGKTEFSLRLFSMFCALLASSGLIALGKRVWHKKSHRHQFGWITAIFFASSGSFLYVAGEVRTYALALALLVWSSVYLWEIWQTPSQIRPSLLAIYLSLAILLVHTHYTAWLGIIAQFVFMGSHILNNQFQGKRLFSIIALGILVGALPWFIALRGRDFNAGTAFEGSVTPQEAIETYLSFYIFGQKVFSYQAIQIGSVIGILAGIGMILWAIQIRKKPYQWINAAFIGSLGLLPLIVLSIAVYQIEGKLSGRHSWVLWTAIAIGLASGVQLVFEQLSQSVLRWSVFVLLPIVPMIVLVSGKSLDDQYPGDFRYAFEILANEADPNDILLLQDGTLFTAAEFYNSPIPYVGIPQDPLTDVKHQVELPEAWRSLETILTDEVRRIWVLSWQGDTMDPTGLAFALPEYLSNGQRQIWLKSPDDIERSEVSLVSYDVRDEFMPIQTHIEQLPDVLQIPPDGPSLLGTEVFKIVLPNNQEINGCGIIIHTWWWRGETDYPNTMMSIRLVNEEGKRLVQRDLPPSGFQFGQEKWSYFVPMLGRTFLPYDCENFQSGEIYSVEMVVYDSANEKPEQPASLATFSIN